jgi:hypothetical protein
MTGNQHHDQERPFPTYNSTRHAGNGKHFNKRGNSKPKTSK